MNLIMPPGSTSGIGAKTGGDTRTSLTGRFADPETIAKKVAKMNMTAD